MQLLHWSDSTPPTGHCRTPSPGCLAVDAAHCLAQLGLHGLARRASPRRWSTRRATPTGLHVPRVSQTRRAMNGMLGAASSIQSATVGAPPSETIRSRSLRAAWVGRRARLSLGHRPMLGPGLLQSAPHSSYICGFASVPTRRRVGYWSGRCAPQAGPLLTWASDALNSLGRQLKMVGSDRFLWRRHQPSPEAKRHNDGFDPYACRTLRILRYDYLVLLILY